MTQKSGQYQGLDGNSVTISADQKITFSNRFIPVSQYLRSTYTYTPSGATPLDIYCLKTSQFNIVQVQEMSASDFVELHKGFDYSKIIDSEKPVYVFLTERTANTSTLYEDFQFSSVSKQTSSEPLKDCQGYAASNELVDNDFIIQYIDNDTFFAFNYGVNIATESGEIPIKYYKTLEGPAYSSEVFLEKAKSVENELTYATTGFGEGVRLAYITFNKEKKWISIRIRESATVGASNGRVYCNFDIEFLYSEISKKNMITFPLMVLRSSYDTYLHTDFNFIDPTRVKLNKVGENSENSVCATQYSSLQDIELNPDSYAIGFQTDRDNKNFFIYSLKNLKIALQVNYSNAYAASNYKY